MSKSGSEGLEILAHLINVMPDVVNARSSAGDTPLLMTFRFQNLEAAGMLIKAGANQMACDNDGGNVLHSLFYFSVDSGSNNTSSHVPEVVSEKHYAHMRAMINLLDPKLLPDMCTQQHHRRDHFSHTPLASLFFTVSKPTPFIVTVTRLILEYSKGAELGLFDNEGNTPLHVVVEQNTRAWTLNFYALAALLLEYRPDLVNMENKDGKTPLDMAQDAALRAMCKGRHSRRTYEDQDYWPLYPKDEWDSLEFSIARTPEYAFTEEGIDNDDFGGHYMANLILSGAADPSSDKDQRIVSLYRLLAETKATLDAQGKGKRILTTTRDIFAAASLDTMQKTNE
jgi:hypothetical protein